MQIAGGDAATSPATIRQILAFSRWLRAQPGVTAVLSPWEPLRGVRAELLADDDQLTVLATLLPLGFPLDAWLDARGRALRISARVTTLDSERFLVLANRARQQAAPVARVMSAFARIDREIDRERAARAERNRRPVGGEARAVGTDQHVGSEQLVMLGA